MMEESTSLPVKHKDDERLMGILTNVGKPPEIIKKPGRRSSSHETGLQAEHKAWVLDFLVALPSPTLCAEVLGVGLSTLYHYRKIDPVFREGWEQAMIDSHDTLLGMASEEAAGIGFDYVVGKEGKVLTVPKNRSEKLLGAFVTFRLGQRVIHEGLDGNDDGTMTIRISPDQIGKLDREERKQLTLILNKLETNAPVMINGNATVHDEYAIQHREEEDDGSEIF